jgi:uncharacterized protein YdcH (DUF465 family)
MLRRFDGFMMRKSLEERRTVWSLGLLGLLVVVLFITLLASVRAADYEACLNLSDLPFEDNYSADFVGVWNDTVFFNCSDGVCGWLGFDDALYFIESNESAYLVEISVPVNVSEGNYSATLNFESVLTGMVGQISFEWEIINATPHLVNDTNVSEPPVELPDFVRLSTTEYSLDLETDDLPMNQSFTVDLFTNPYRNVTVLCTGMLWCPHHIWTVSNKTQFDIEVRIPAGTVGEFEEFLLMWYGNKTARLTYYIEIVESPSIGDLKLQPFAECIARWSNETVDGLIAGVTIIDYCFTKIANETRIRNVTVNKTIITPVPAIVFSEAFEEKFLADAGTRDTLTQYLKQMMDQDKADEERFGAMLDQYNELKGRVVAAETAQAAALEAELTEMEHKTIRKAWLWSALGVAIVVSIVYYIITVIRHNKSPGGVKFG